MVGDMPANSLPIKLVDIHFNFYYKHKEIVL